jgi:cytochrome c553
MWAPRIPLYMTPNPPGLSMTSSKWSDGELFYITKHGLKFTGMPAWPAQERDDEVWALVAFMRRLERMDAREYSELVGESEARREVRGITQLDNDAQGVVHALASRCARCHGADGRGRLPGAFPRLAGQNALYLEQALEAYALRNRHSGIMEPIAAGLTPDEMRGVSAYYAALGDTTAEAAPAVPDERLLRGGTIAMRGIPELHVPSCVSCHGPGAPVNNPAYPVLAGQDPAYLAGQLELFRQGKRGGGPFSGIMQEVVRRLTSEQIRDVAAFYGAQATTRP